jgi:hypothetical protein
VPGAEPTRPAKLQRAPGRRGGPEGLADRRLCGDRSHLEPHRTKGSGGMACCGPGRVVGPGQGRLPGITKRRLPLVDDVHHRHGHEQHDQARHVGRPAYSRGSGARIVMALAVTS